MSVDEFKNLLWGPSVKEDVFKRWSQGFVFSDAEPTALVQWEGGPCAVLAPVQAFILKSLIQGNSLREQWRTVDPSQCNELLASALSEVLLQAAVEDHSIKLFRLDDALQPQVSSTVEESPASVEAADDQPNQESEASPAKPAEEIEVCSSDFHQRLQVENVSRENLPAEILKNIDKLKSTYGVLLFLYSVLGTRGLEEMKNELSDIVEPMIDDNHGYGSQSLINLVLTGRAVGNVWDGDQNVGGLNLRGIDRQSEVGFLTLLEHLRYLEVGSFYKSPKTPVWVLGSETHLTVLFSVEKKLVSPETASEAGRRVFKSFDPEGNNFIQTKFLADVLKALDLVSEPEYVEIIRKKIDSENLGIILLNAFMEEFFPTEKSSTPDTFPLYHYNGLHRSCPNGKVEYIEGQAVTLESLVGPSMSDSNAMLTCLQTKWPSLEVQWLATATPSLN
ncbi:ubiquitin carboxyl-terminal hydrolase MINDY-3 homolog [Neocloeon triangulifer]|uniref:ubiquitin carboxyl-terminal hydrolase MINDY-3 homolog n=1 Tax=Neocloeon triangulifer TaxID=2078957 RepID=UPI00286FA33F|nr:ubiquitin carboxyl-terminal hydrolase MINDY-3 homolog [Neocloeon triangulifer]XP_059472024.1 ubiquitin carboxyl-terminal hydrolase MINDY-3 homolog [Neocloeon triangulifer]XP_059472025.1 ubiquitin carboxyl-terminal hydrolase MINDY-3 homolog [Neocloeon triangulifer]